MGGGEGDDVEIASKRFPTSFGAEFILRITCIFKMFPVCHNMLYYDTFDKLFKEEKRFLISGYT